MTAPKYGEPWRSESDWTEEVYAADGVLIGKFQYPREQDKAARAIACVNALAGIDDPLSFVRAVRIVVASEILDLDGDPGFDQLESDLGFARLSPDEVATALRALLDGEGK